jgi:hydrogenase maturation factor HypF (carbamoyltransferase family)
METDIKIKNSYKLVIRNPRTNTCMDDKNNFSKDNGAGIWLPEKIYFEIDDSYIFSQIVEDIKKGLKAKEVSAKFHNTLLNIILFISLETRKALNINTAVLSGGVFQNNIMIKGSLEMLESRGFSVYSSFKTPVNDGGISLGQAYIAAKSQK